MRNEHDVRPIRPRRTPIPRNPLHDIIDPLTGSKLERPNGNVALSHSTRASVTMRASVTRSTQCHPELVEGCATIVTGARLSKGARAHGSVSSACVRSAKMSSTDSIPTDNRTASSLTPLAI